jgi:hypothetical protein
MKWDSEALWLKARKYVDKANELQHTDPDFPFWSALALEFLARSALSHIHPTLNADPGDPHNLLYALGFDVAGHPRSIPIHSVYLRLEKTIPGFAKSQRELCDYMGLMRNEELHTGELGFAALPESKWLPRYYEVCRVLCGSMGKTLVDYLGVELAGPAEHLIATLSEELITSVRSKIAAHARVFEDKPTEEQESLRTLAESRARLTPTGLTTHPCPACGSDGLLRGDLIKQLRPEYEEEMLLVDQEYLAVEFKCLACDLALHSPEEVAPSGIEPRFSQRRATSLHELFEPEYYDEYMNM